MERKTNNKMLLVTSSKLVKGLFPISRKTGQESKSTMKTLSKFPGSANDAFGSRTTRTGS